MRRIQRALDDASRADLSAQCARALAAIHRADPAGIGLTAVRSSSTTGTPNSTRWATPRRRSSGRSGGWPRTGPPPSPNVLVHGDFRMGNLIIDTAERPARLAAVLDWELTHTGEVYEDLAWFCIRAWRFGAPRVARRGRARQHRGLPRAPTRTPRAPSLDRAAMRWWLVLSTLRWGVICRYQAERHLSGQTRSVELAAIGRRVCETEFDLLTLLEARRDRTCTAGRPPPNSSPPSPSSSRPTSGRPPAGGQLPRPRRRQRAAHRRARTARRRRSAPDLLGFPDERRWPRRSAPATSTMHRSAGVTSRCTTRARVPWPPGRLSAHPLTNQCGAISVGIIDGSRASTSTTPKTRGPRST